MTNELAPPREEAAFTIDFPNQNRAIAIDAPTRVPASALLSGLGLSGPRPILLVVGGADGLAKAAEPRLRDLIGSGALVAAETAGAVVVDGGTASGIIAIVGESVAAAHAPVTLLGVAPSSRVTWRSDTRPKGDERTELEPNHSHFILADGDTWGDETPLMMEAVEALADPSQVTALVAGGGPITRREVEAAVGRGIPIVAISGTGGFADDLVAIVTANRNTRTAASGEMAAIVSEIDLAVVPLDAPPALLGRTLLRRLQPDATMQAATRQYHTLARAARQERRSFARYQLVIPALGLLVTTLVVIQAQLRDSGALVEGAPQDQAIQYAIALIPIAVGVLVAGAARLRPGARWVLLRGAAETIKGQLYRYRTRTGLYAVGATRRTSREVKLATTVGATMQSLMLTEVNLSALDPGDKARGLTTGVAAGDADDGFRPLGPDEYLRYRIDDQIGFYQKSVRSREQRVRTLRWLTLGFGGLGSALAIIGFQLWVAVVIALVAAVTTWMEAMQLESTITLYNQAATSLDAIKSWWTALPPAEQVRRPNFDELVDRAERVMQAEHAGWVQEMQDAMTRLHLEEREAKDAEARSSAGTDEADPTG